MNHAAAVWTLALAVVAALCSAARAQQYTAYEDTGQYVTRPATAKALFLLPTGERAWFEQVTFDFPVSYYGTAYDTAWAGSCGFVQFGAAYGSSNGTNGQFPAPGDADGLCAPLWDSPGNYAWTWTDGTSPNRRAIVSWDNAALGYPANARKVSFQVQFHEGTGHIVFAYRPAVTGDGWNSGESYSLGIDAPGDSRYVTPEGNHSTMQGHPGSDWRFVPTSVRVSGRLTHDRLVPGTTGIGATVADSVPLAGLRVELRRTSSNAAVTWTDAQGNYALDVHAALAGGTARVVVLADSDACVVRPSAGAAARSVEIATSVSLDSAQALGTTRLGATEDPGGTSRAPLAIVQTIRALQAWTAGETTSAVPKLEVLWDPSSTAPTSYAPAGTSTAASIRVGGSGSGNEDAWDRAVLARVWGRHVLANVSVLATDLPAYGWNVSSTPRNAFADAFGWALHSAVFGGGSAVDGIDATQGVEYDVESPGTTEAASGSVTAWVAGMLHDLVDAANETTDRIDGTVPGAAGRFLRVVDAATAPPDADTFLALWESAGHDPVPLVRSYVAHGLLPDDADEPNDDAGEPFALGDAGVLRRGRTLQVRNDDWWSVKVPSGNDGLFAAVVFDRARIAAHLGLEIRSPAGQVLASASTASGLGAVTCATGTLAPGTYLVRVAHVSGAAVTDYSVQAHVRLRIGAAPLPEWTVGVPYHAVVDVTGGIPPYTLNTVGGAPMPPGFALHADTRVVNGTPTKPGAWSLVLLAQDSGDPFSSATASKALVVNPELVLRAGEFTAFALGRAPLQEGVGAGGTAPVSTRVTLGRLPAGIGLVPGRLGFDGAPTTEESVRFAVESADAVGARAEASTLGVVCVDATGGRARAALAEGDAACGVFFDAVAGSSVRASFATAKKMPKRTLRGVVLGTDATTPLEGGKARAGTGRLSLSGFVVPESGRYFAVAGAAEGAPTALDATVAVAPPKSGKGATESLDADALLEVPVGALAGAKLTLQAAPSRGSGARVRIRNLVDPDGVPVLPGDAAVETKQGGVKLGITLPAAGTWRVVLEVRDAASAVKYAYRIAQPRKAAYTAD